MPELPEVETVVRQLEDVLPGQVVAEVDVRREKSARAELKQLVGKRFASVKRKAKYILMRFDRWDQVLVMHLKMTGQLVYQQQAASNKQQAYRVVGGHPTKDWVDELPSKHTRIVLYFDDGGTLYFNDQRVFGWMDIMSKQQLSVMMSKLPPDVVDDEFTVDYLAGVLKRSSRAVKLVILNQQKMGGMGNIYANDALHMAQIKPTRKATTLKAQEVDRLYEAMRVVLNKGIRLGGASYSHFVHVSGMGGTYQDEFVVYDKEGKPCPREGCRGVLIKTQLGGRGTYYCPVCQK